jgi:hypothetical protein
MDLPYVQYRDLFVYTNKLYGGTVESDRERMENVRTPASPSSSVQRHLRSFRPGQYKNNMKRVSMYNCYGNVTFISANLTDEQDPYPSKTRNNGVIADLFFKIFEVPFSFP